MNVVSPRFPGARATPRGRKTPCYTVTITSTHELKSLSEDELLRRLAELVQRSRRVEAVLVAHIAEVDERRLSIREAPSMFAYCTQVLHLSEHEAYARITVARASRRHPSLLAMLSDGRLHLSGIGKLVPHLTDANAADLLARAAHRTKSEIEELIAEIAPKPDVPALIRKVPVREGAAMTGQLGPDRVDAVGTSELGPDRVGVSGDALPLLAPAPTVHASPPERDRQLSSPPNPLRPTPQAAVVIPLSPTRYKVQFTARAELREKLERLQALLGHDLATVIEAAVAEKLERLEAKRFGLTKTPRRTLDDTDISPRSRHLPAAVRRSVRERDGAQCTFLLRNGRRCSERRSLEFHHRHPYGLGGNHDPDNVCLMCRQHNAFLAELDYGKEHMEQYRRRGDRGFEGVPLAMFAQAPD